MTTIQTTLGPRDVSTLGKTLIHEHVLVGYPGWFIDNRMPRFVRAEALDRVVDAFQRLHAYGVKTVVDPCPMDLGRDVEFVAEVSQRSGVTLICTTGVYTETHGIPFALRHYEIAEIADIFQREIEDGIGATGIRPGLIKIATGDGVVSDYERKMLTAATQAAKRTGLPLISHTENCSCGRDDHEYQVSLARRGAYVGFDRFGLEFLNSDENRMKNVKQMIDAGFRDHLLLSHDSVGCWLGGVPGVGNPELAKHVVPNWNLTHLFERIFPALRKMGVSDADLDHIVTENPRRYLAGLESPGQSCSASAARS